MPPRSDRVSSSRSFQRAVIRSRPLTAEELSRTRFSFFERSTAESHEKPTTAGCIVAMLRFLHLWMYYTPFLNTSQHLSRISSTINVLHAICHQQIFSGR